MKNIVCFVSMYYFGAIKKVTTRYMEREKTMLKATDKDKNNNEIKN